MGTALLATLLLRIVARTCLVCGHIAHKRQGESKVYVCKISGIQLNIQVKTDVFGC